MNEAKDIKKEMLDSGFRFDIETEDAAVEALKAKCPDHKDIEET